MSQPTRLLVIEFDGPVAEHLRTFMGPDWKVIGAGGTVYHGGRFDYILIHCSESIREQLSDWFEKILPIALRPVHDPERDKRIFYF